MDLLDLLREQDETTEHGDDRREWVHATMPNMAYACGGDIVRGLPDHGPRGRNILGGWSVERFPELTCPHCRRWTVKGMAMRAHRQQIGPHDCTTSTDPRCVSIAALPGMTPEQVESTTPEPYPSTYWSQT